MSYLPIPPRAWSRVEGNINCVSPLLPPLGKYEVYVPLSKQTVPPAIADQEERVLYKGNILQYKKNSSNLTKKQIYSQMARKMWVNKKTYATQSIDYTNPNSNSLYRKNGISVSFPNDLPGRPGNSSGPFAELTYNPFNCPNSILTDGGNLICGTLANPCTNELIKSSTSYQKCALITASNVPGFRVPGIPKTLCWNKKLSVYYPRRRLTMSNSQNKWPTNYKEFTSGLRPIPPILSINDTTNTSVTLAWTFDNKLCIPTTKFYIYQNNSIINTVSITQSSIIIDNLSPNIYSFYITSVSNSIQSAPSNTVVVSIS